MPELMTLSLLVAGLNGDNQPKSRITVTDIRLVEPNVATVRIIDRAVDQVPPDGNKYAIETRKRRATKRALLHAARELVFEKKHNNLSVQEITRTAKVATGTYYNYFENKQEIFLAVADEYRKQIMQRIDAVRHTMTDPAMLVAVTTKLYFHQSVENQPWCDFTRQAQLTDLSLQQPPAQCLEDLQSGADAGSFLFDDINFTQKLLTDIVAQFTRSLQSDTHDVSNEIRQATRAILQLLGLPATLAGTLAQTPLPLVE